MLSKSTIKNSNDRKNTSSLSIRSTKLTGNKLASLCLQNKTQCIGFYARTYKKNRLHTGFIYIIHCKFKRHNHQVPKAVRVAGNKTNTKKRKEKFTNNASNYNKHRMY